MSDKLNINQWAAEDRPREKMERLGPQALSDAELLVPDGNGRILLPKRYLKMAGIESEVRFIGMDNTIEIWSSERAEQPFMEAEDFSKALQDTLGNDSMWHFMEDSNDDE